LPPKDEYVVSTSDFDRVKARLIALDSKLVAAGSQQEGGSKRPTLKRRTSTDRSEQEEPSLKQDRPSLKRPSLKKEADDDTGDDTGDDDSR